MWSGLGAVAALALAVTWLAAPQGRSDVSYLFDRQIVLTMVYRTSDLIEITRASIAPLDCGR